MGLEEIVNKYNNAYVIINRKNNSVEGRLYLELIGSTRIETYFFSNYKGYHGARPNNFRELAKKYNCKYSYVFIRYNNTLIDYKNYIFSIYDVKIDYTKTKKYNKRMIKVEM